jgi:hypothetical protein
MSDRTTDCTSEGEFGVEIKPGRGLVGLVHNVADNGIDLRGTGSRSRHVVDVKGTEVDDD